MDPTARIPQVSSTSVKRTPLAERQPRTRQSSNVSKASVSSRLATPSRIPHHESVYPEGNLSVVNRHQASSPRPSRSPRPTNDRIIAIAEDEPETNKRDSQISTTSTASGGRSKRKTHIGPWQLGRTLGKGATGRVRLAKHAQTGQIAAIKIVSKKSAAMVQSASMRQMDKDSNLSSNISGARTMPFGIEREIVIMKLIEHPNVVSLYDIWENRGELYLVLEYVEGGELFDYVMRNGALPEGEAVRLLRQLIAGLAYCHRFNICHRDLKPENILLDQDHNIKIADFGMAALQPNGQYLTTSCGSPHYAAPEIIAGKQYRGDQADIWSVGIILYAMLNGFLPFDGGDLHSTLALVKKGEYYLSPNLSVEASDLIQRVLQKRPDRRISMNDIWKHPLLKKYEKIHASLAAPGKLAGPPPPLTAADCGPRRIRPSDIERDLLRNLQVLWHGLDEQEVISRLTSDEPNHEKLFYWSLVRFRDEQLENYPGEVLQYSASDYHHLKQPTPRLAKSTTKSALHQRRTSQFSIISEGSIARTMYYKNPGTAASKTTQASYDPYRASRRPVHSSQSPSSSVIVRPSGTTNQGQVAISNRRNDLAEVPEISVPEVPCLTDHDLQKIIARKVSTFSTASTHSSLASSQRKRTFRTSTSYRRNVSFQHHRSQPSRTTSSSRKQSSSSSRPITQDSNQTFSASVPSLPTPNPPARPKRPASDMNLYPDRPLHTPWREDTRKVSAELSKICEEAFNRSSVSCESDLSQQLPVDSPATTVSVPAAILSNLNRAQMANLNPVLRDLLERRAKIIETWGKADQKTLSDLISMIDHRIAEEQYRIELHADRRSASDPTNHKYNKLRDTTSTVDTMKDTRKNRTDARAASDPLHRQENTIRMVTPDAVSPPARVSSRPSKAAPINSLKGGPINDGSEAYDERLLAGHHLEPIFEDSPLPMKQPLAEPRKWSWLGKRAVPSNDDLPPTPPRKDTPKDHQSKAASRIASTTGDANRNTAEAAEVEASKRTWFQKVFKRRKEQAAALSTDHEVLFDAEAEFDSMNDLFTPERQAPAQGGHLVVPGMGRPGALSPTSRAEQSQNWFAKILHLKPATDVLIMQATKAQARKEIVKILREWRRFGIRDVAVEKSPTGDVIRARVDATNYLRIRPVQFFAMVYTVLERGKSANLSIIKFTQEKGAASSFHRVVDTIASVLGESDTLLVDAEKRKKILKSMKQAGL